MRPSALVNLSWQAVKAQPVRTLLTMLGISWGVASFVILIAYGTGMQKALYVGLSYFGDNVVVVQNGQTSLQAGGQRAGRPIRMEKSDVEAVRAEVPLIKRISGEVFRRFKVEYQQRRTTAGIRGVEGCYGEVRGMFMAAGRFLADEENLQMARVAVLGDEIRERLFSSIPAVGREIKVNGIRFTVIGVLRKKIAISNYYSPDDMCIMVPLNTMALFTDTRYLSNLVYQPVSPAMEEQARRQFRAVMGRRHGFDPADDKALTGWSYSQVKEIIDGITGATKATMVLVGFITLCIGGIGVMNIMLASVKSRIREIGTVMAIGAKRRHVLLQFLFETLILTSAGGVLGYLAALGAAHLIGGIPFLGVIFEDTSGQGDITLVVGGGAFLTAFVVLAGVSLFFGLWPARQAARQEPVQALHYE